MKKHIKRILAAIVIGVSVAPFSMTLPAYAVMPNTTPMPQTTPSDPFQAPAQASAVPSIVTNGPYNIIFMNINKEGTEEVNGGVWRLEKTENAQIDATGMISMLPLPSPMAVQVNVNYSNGFNPAASGLRVPDQYGFIVSGQTQITLPPGAGMGKYQLVNIAPAPGYALNPYPVPVEFPEIENSRYTDDQTQRAKIPLQELKKDVTFSFNVTAPDGNSVIPYDKQVLFSLVQTSDRNGPFTAPKEIQKTGSDLTKEANTITIQGLPIGTYKMVQINNENSEYILPDIEFAVQLNTNLDLQLAIVSSSNISSKSDGNNIQVVMDKGAKVETRFLTESESEFKDEEQKLNTTIKVGEPKKILTTIRLPEDSVNFKDIKLQTIFPDSVKIPDTKDIRVQINGRDTNNIAIDRDTNMLNFTLDENRIRQIAGEDKMLKEITLKYEIRGYESKESKTKIVNNLSYTDSKGYEGRTAAKDLNVNLMMNGFTMAFKDRNSYVPGAVFDVLNMDGTVAESINGEKLSGLVTQLENYNVDGVKEGEYKIKFTAVPSAYWKPVSEKRIVVTDDMSKNVITVKAVNWIGMLLGGLLAAAIAGVAAYFLSADKRKKLLEDKIDKQVEEKLNNALGKLSKALPPPSDEAREKSYDGNIQGAELMTPRDPDVQSEDKDEDEVDSAEKWRRHYENIEKDNSPEEKDDTEEESVLTEDAHGVITAYQSFEDFTNPGKTEESSDEEISDMSREEMLLNMDLGLSEDIDSEDDILPEDEEYLFDEEEDTEENFSDDDYDTETEDDDILAEDEDEEI